MCTTKATPKRRATFIRNLAEFGNISMAARAADIDRGTAYRWKQEDNKFSDEWDVALDAACDMLEMEARRRAFEGLVHKKFDKGEPIIDPETGEQYIEREYSDTLMIVLLKGNRPEKFRENTTVKHEGSVQVLGWADVEPVTRNG